MRLCFMVIVITVPGSLAASGRWSVGHSWSAGKWCWTAALKRNDPAGADGTPPIGESRTSFPDFTLGGAGGPGCSRKGRCGDAKADGRSVGDAGNGCMPGRGGGGPGDGGEAIGGLVDEVSDAVEWCIDFNNGLVPRVPADIGADGCGWAAWLLAPLLLLLLPSPLYAGRSDMRESLRRGLRGPRSCWTAAFS